MWDMEFGIHSSPKALGHKKYRRGLSLALNLWTASICGSQGGQESVHQVPLSTSNLYIPKTPMHMHTYIHWAKGINGEPCHISLRGASSTCSKGPYSLKASGGHGETVLREMMPPHLGPPSQQSSPLEWNVRPLPASEQEERLE